jgi:UTP-glucose-1-phosphate uridylyltransferase
MTSPTLLVLAAGMGSRYGGLKQIEPVGPPRKAGKESGRETIIDYSVYDAIRAGFGKVVFVLRKEIEQAFRERVAARFEKYIAVEYVSQELDKLPAGFSVPSGRTKPWGTTHAVLMAAQTIQEPFAVINADDFYGAHSYRVLVDHLQSGSQDYAMVGFVLRNTLSNFGSVARGICNLGSDNTLQSVVELTHLERDGDAARNIDAAGCVTNLTGDELVSMNMWGFTPQVFSQLREEFERFLVHRGSELQSECYLPSTVNALVSSGHVRVNVLRSSDSWFGVTYREDHAHVVESIGRLIREGYYPERLWA